MQVMEASQVGIQLANLSVVSIMAIGQFFQGHWSSFQYITHNAIIIVMIVLWGLALNVS